MKKFITKYLAFIVLLASVALLMPATANRITNESKNNNIVMSVLYNDIEKNLSKSQLDFYLEEYKKNGINIVSLIESDLNNLVIRGEVSCVKYKVLCGEYDDKSIRLSNFIKENCPDIAYDSYVAIVEKDKMKARFKEELPKRYTSDEYISLGECEGADIYVFYDGTKQLWEYSLGYNEDIIRTLREKGFEVALLHKLVSNKNTDYLADIDALVKKYDIEYLNLKKTTANLGEINEDNYKGIADIINNNNMTLVLTENENQLSNQKFFGYEHVFAEVTKDGGSNKVIRSYETYDKFTSDEEFYILRADQYFNSTIDRSLRFITITQIIDEKASHEECAENTLKATILYKDKIEKQGFSVNADVNTINYDARRTVISALCAVVMIMSLLLVIEMIRGKRSFALNAWAIILSAAAFVGTAILPVGLVMLYPTVFCIVESCTAITAVLYFIKTKSEKLNLFALIGGAFAIMLGVLFVYSACLGALLSGLDYYVNNNIFRGIKVSLIVPIFYTTVVYYLMFIKDEKRSFIKDIGTVFTAEIKVYWMLIALAIIGVMAYYIIRSGNVSEISSIEATMRNILTNIFSERPRTKEFLIGYPALALFVYYAKKTDWQLVRWVLAIAMSILAASVTNSFCHVFTDFSVIVMRTLNGLIAGIAVTIAVYVLNLILVKILKTLKSKFSQERR